MNTEARGTVSILEVILVAKKNKILCTFLSVVSEMCFGYGIVKKV